MAAVANCSRRLVWRPSAAFVLPVRQRALASIASSSAPTPRHSPLSPMVAAPKTATAAFSTSAPAHAKASQHIRAGRKTQVSRKKKKKDFNAARGKPAAPGERKAFRKRIVLSNNNALEVPGLEELTAQHLAGGGTITAAPGPEGGEEAAATVGRVLALPDALVDQLRAVDAFKPTQSFPLFRRPSLLVRQETAALAAALARTAATKETLRLVIDGERIAGKSILLLQAMAHGFLNDWIVFHIPEAQELTTACTEYAAIPGTEPTQWAQPVYVLKLLRAFEAANARVLGPLTTRRAHDALANPVPAGAPLLDLLAAAKETDHAWPVFQALWAELLDPAAEGGRPPVLFALDGLAHVMKVSDYRSPAFERIHAHDLALVRLFVDALSGRTEFPHGAAVLAATTRGNSPANATVDLALAQRRKEQEAADPASADIPTPDPYFRGYDARVADALRTVRVLDLKGVTKPEARALLEYWAASGLLRERVDEAAVAGAWTLAGNGVVGEMERAALLSLRV